MKKDTEKKQTTHFGFTEVNVGDKSNLVADVFHSVASKYDLMNDVMSLGMHRLWKKFTIDQAQVKPSQKILDVAGGTGDLTKEFSKKVGPEGEVILADINIKMLEEGRNKLTDSGIVNNVSFVQADAENLPFEDNYFDCITIAFGLRNVTNKLNALKSMYRILKPAGRLLVLEFSKPTMPLLDKIYDSYSFNVIPKLGEFITNDKESYQYLVESIRMHPNQESLKKMMEEAQFEDVEFFNLAGGIVALHKGFKY